MRKNMIFRRVTSLILSTTLIASNAVFTQGSEMQTEQVLMEESQSAATANENEQETFVQQLEEETAACESTLETSEEETFADITQSVNESISTESEVQITEQVSEESEEQETETVQESVYEDEEESELASESASESETFDEFEDVIGVEEDYDDSNVYQEGEEFVKTFSIDEYRNVDSNPVYLGMAGISTATAKYYDQLDTVSKRIYDQIYEANKSGANTTKLKLNLTKIFENQTVTKGANGKTVYSEEKGYFFMARQLCDTCLSCINI